MRRDWYGSFSSHGGRHYQAVKNSASRNVLERRCDLFDGVGVDLRVDRREYPLLRRSRLLQESS